MNEVFRPTEYTLADQAGRDARAVFIVRTYVHLFGAVFAFIIIEAALLLSPVGGVLAQSMTRGLGGYSWLLVLGAFLVVSYIAERWAQSDASLGMQYLGLALYVLAEAVIFVPLMYVAAFYGGADVIPTAGILTACAFTGLTSFVFFTRKNFSFLAPFLGVAAIIALGGIVLSILLGFSLGILFTAALILLACGYILYYTSKVLHEYRVDQHVAASLSLFASVALMFWWIVRLLMFSRD